MRRAGYACRSFPAPSLLGSAVEKAAKKAQRGIPRLVWFREPRRRGGCIVVKQRLEAGMPRTTWLLAAAACSPCSCRRVRCPTHRVWWPRRSAPQRSVGRAVQGGLHREAARALAAVRTRRRGGRRVFDFPRFTDPLSAGCPGTRARSRSPPTTAARCPDRVSVTVVPSAGLMGAEAGTWVTLPSESKEAYAKLTAGLTPRPARTFPGVGEDELPVGRGDEVFESPSAATPGPERRLEGLDRRAGRRRASGAHSGVAAQDPPPPRIDAASGARGTGVGTVGSAPDVRQRPGNSG